MDLIENKCSHLRCRTIMPKLNSERGKKWFWQDTGWVVVMHLGYLEIFCELCRSWHLALFKCYSFQGYTVFTQTLLYFMTFFWRILHMAWVRTVGAFLRTGGLHPHFLASIHRYRKQWKPMHDIWVVAEIHINIHPGRGTKSTYGLAEPGSDAWDLAVQCGPQGQRPTVGLDLQDPCFFSINLCKWKSWIFMVINTCRLSWAERRRERTGVGAC